MFTMFTGDPKVWLSELVGIRSDIKLNIKKITTICKT